MKIVLFGEDFFSATVLQSLIEEGHGLMAVICPLYPNHEEDKKLEKISRQKNVPFFRLANVNDETVVALIKDIQPDFIVSVHLRKILQKNIYSLARIAAINVHPSLLPKYRGLSPQHQALLHGDSITGVTVHFIEDAVDTGDIIIQEKIPLTFGDSIFDLQVAMLVIYQTLVNRAIELLTSKNFTPVPQVVSESSWFNALKDSDRKIDLKKAKFAVYNLIRAVSKPYKGAYYDGYVIWSSFIPDDDTSAKYLKQYPETGIHAIDDLLLIRMEDGILLSEDFEAGPK